MPDAAQAKDEKPAAKAGDAQDIAAPNQKGGVVSWAEQKVPVVTSDDPASSGIGAASGLLVGALLGLLLVSSSLPAVSWAIAFSVLCVASTGIGAAAVNLFRRRFSAEARAFANYQRDLHIIDQARLPAEQASQERAKAYDRYVQATRPPSHRFEDGEAPSMKMRIAPQDIPTEDPDDGDPSADEKKRKGLRMVKT